MGHLEDQARAIGEILTSLRMSIERAHGVKELSHPGVRREVHLLLSKLEGIKILVSGAYRLRYRPTESEWKEILDESHYELTQMLNDKHFKRIGGAPYRPSVVMTNRKPRRPLLDGRYDVGMPIIQAVHMLINDLKFMANDVPDQDLFAENIVDGLQKLSALKRIVPDQKASPVKFEISDGKIVLVDQNVAPHKDADIADQAKGALLEQGKVIIDELSKSNCDRRLLDSVVTLQENIESGSNIIKLGLMSATCALMCETFSPELPDAVCAMLRAQVANVSMYVAQFPEWARFTENAASVALDSADLEEIARAASNVVSELERKPELSDPKVPKTIALLNELLSNPQSSSKRAGFAMLRTLENLLACILTFGAEFFEQFGQETASGLAKACSKTVVAALLGVALIGASGLTGVTSKITESGWIKTASELIKTNAMKLD